jgi:hypothetical protein
MGRTARNCGNLCDPFGLYRAGTIRGSTDRSDSLRRAGPVFEGREGAAARTMPNMSSSDATRSVATRLVVAMHCPRMLGKTRLREGAWSGDRPLDPICASAAFLTQNEIVQPGLTVPKSKRFRPRRSFSKVFSSFRRLSLRFQASFSHLRCRITT